MADNQQVNVNTGAAGAVNVSIASDDIGGVVHPYVKLEVGGEGVAVPVDGSNPLPVTATVPGSVAVTGPLTDAQLRASSVPVSLAVTNVVDAGNSTTTPLGANATYIGSAVDLLGYTSVAASCYSDVPSIEGGVVAQFSPDGVNWDDRVKKTYVAGGTVSDLVVRPHDRYFRVKYTNDGSPQSAFRLQTILVRNPPALADSVGIDHVPISGDDAILTKSIISGKTTAGGGAYVDVKVNPSGALVADVSGTVTATGPLTDTQLRASAVAVSAASLPLPAGAATQTTLASIDTKTPALGQGTMAASSPVVIASNQSAVPVSDGGGSLTVDGSVTVSGTVTATGPLTDTQLRATAVPVSAASLPLPSGAATETTLAAVNTKTPALGQAVMASSTPVVIASNQSAVSVTGPLTDTQLRAAAVPVSGTVTATGPLTDAQLRATAVPVSGPLTDTQLRATAVPVSAASLPLPAGAATQTTLSSIDGKTPALGQAAMAASSPVVIASNQTAIPVTGSFSVAGSVTPADGTTNPANAQPCVSYLSGYNGATWDLLRSSIANGLEVDATRVRAHEAAFTPGYDGPSAAAGELNVDPEGHLIMRGPVHTDESSFRINFANSSLAVSVGSPTRTGLVFSGGNLGDALLDLHVGDYIKFDADPESAWAAIEQIDGTTVTVAAYTGSATSGAASRSLVLPYSGTSGTLTVASGKLTIASGTTSGSVAGVSRFVDYAPLVCRGSVQLSQRIANQDFVLGLQEDAPTVRWFARFRYTGTTNTQVVCETARNPTTAPSAAETQSQTVYLPNGGNTSTAHEFRIELLFERVTFYIDDVLVATNTRTIPGPVDEMALVAEWTNTGTPATSSNAVVDYLASKNANKLEIGVMSDTERLIAALQPMKEFSFSQAGVIAINTDLLVIDCRQLAAINIQCSSMGTSGVVTPQWANDPAFSVVVGATVTTPAGADATTFNGAGIWSTPVVARYLRLRLTTATTAGTTTLAVNGSSFPVQTRLATQPVSGTVAVSTIAGAITPGTAATNLGKAEDAAAASGDVGLFTLAVRRDALTTSASATGDYNEMACNRFGALQMADFRTNARSFRAAGNVTLAASATDVFDLPGNATTTVVVTRIAISGVATSAAQADILVVKRSTANSAGTRVAMTAVPLDSTDSAASSTPGLYTANPTTGTLVGAVGRQHVGLLTAAGTGEVGHEWNFGERGKGLVLSGTAQVLALNLNGVTVTGGVVNVEVDWYEF